MFSKTATALCRKLIKSGETRIQDASGTTEVVRVGAIELEATARKKLAEVMPDMLQGKRQWVSVSIAWICYFSPDVSIDSEEHFVITEREG